jgi:transposase
LPSSKLAETWQYALNQWARLKVYLQNGRVEIDQNLCENAMRRLALGRKNWLHIGSQEAGPKIAAMLSIMETCKPSRSTCTKYLSDVLPKLLLSRSTRAQSFRSALAASISIAPSSPTTVFLL